MIISLKPFLKKNPDSCAASSMWGAALTAVQGGGAGDARGRHRAPRHAEREEPQSAGARTAPPPRGRRATEGRSPQHALGSFQAPDGEVRDG